MRVKILRARFTNDITCKQYNSFFRHEPYHGNVYFYTLTYGTHKHEQFNLIFTYKYIAYDYLH